MRVKEVKYVEDCSIVVSFEDETAAAIRLNDLVEKGIFRELQNQAKFSKVYTMGYSIAWSDKLEITVKQQKRTGCFLQQHSRQGLKLVFYLLILAG